MGVFSLGILPGICTAIVKDEATDTANNIFSLAGFLFYEYHFENSFLFTGVRYSYLYDKSSPLSGIGCTLGIGYMI